MLKEAINFLKGAVERKGTALYTFHDGVARARNHIMEAAHPVPELQGTFALAADDLDAALARMPSDPDITTANNAIVLKCGCFKSTLQVLSTDEPLPFDRSSDWLSLPKKFIERLGMAKVFANTDTTKWHSGIFLGDGLIRATDGRVAIEIEMPELKAPNISFPTEVVAYLEKRQEDPTQWYQTDNSTSFWWSNGAWLCCQHTWEWPTNVFDPLFAHCRPDTPVKIDDAWRAVLSYAVARGSGEVQLHPDGFHARSGHAEHDAEHATGVEGETLWASDALQRVVAVATAFDPDSPTGVSRFVGDNLKGIIAGKR